jgi:hypothetical protein
MEYILLIHADEKSWEAADEQQRRELHAQHGAFMAMLQARGAARGGAQLASTSSATTLRHHGDKVGVTDGPFAETAEQLGGFYVVEAADLADAIELAKQLPATTVEVRALVPMRGDAG